MNTLYIDIDDTLVTWLSEEDGPHPYGAGAKEWRVNQGVLGLAERWEGPIVVWSGGGKDYAEMWGNRLLHHLNWTASAKFNPGVEEGDLFIDDSPFDAWKHACIHPRDLSS